MRINSLNRIESSTKVLAFPSDLMSKLDPQVKQDFIKVCLALGITNDTDFEKIPSSNFKRGSLKKLLNQYGEWFVIVGITSEGTPWYSYMDQKTHKQIILPKVSSFYSLVDDTAALYIAHGGQELADQLAQKQAERAAYQSFKFYFDRNKLERWNQKYLDKSGYETRTKRLNNYSNEYGLTRERNLKYFDIIEKDPEGKLESLRAQYTKYLNAAVQNVIANGFDEKSLDALHMVVRVGQSVRGSEFDDIKRALDAGDTERAVEYMVDFQAKLDRYKRTGRV